MQARPLANAFAYIPAVCYANTRDEAGRARNPCYTCHVASDPPNYADDEALQLVLRLPAAAAAHRWTNLLSPASERVPAPSDDELLAYVRRSNYFDDAGQVTLAHRLSDLPEAWDGEGDARWNGFIPDAHFRFDADGFDHRPDGTATGWRALAYYPLPGSFPSAGSAGDVLIRLDPALRTPSTALAEPEELVTRLNFAIVEALIRERDVPIAPLDERRVGVDLDLDGQLGTARSVKFERDAAGGTRMQYVGRARELLRAGHFPIAPGLFPLGTEFLHTLRYLDVEAGRVRMAARMKELRYAQKVRWFSPRDLAARASAEAVEQLESPNGARYVLWEFDRGVYNGRGWLLSDFIEDAQGALRPATHEESAFCVGCHGGVGATTDSIFSFARKHSAPNAGYSYASAREPSALPEPRTRDGTYEYTQYLRENRGADAFADNRELRERFFTANGALRPAAERALHRDVSPLLWPSPTRALALDRAYRAIVVEQSFTHGRDALQNPDPSIQGDVTAGAPTGIERPVRTQRLQ